jgi:hypothetical protein
LLHSSARPPSPVCRTTSLPAAFTSLAPVDWTKPEPDVVEPLIKAVDAMSDDEKQRVVLDAGRVAALADEPGQNALQNVVQNRAVFDALEGANNRSLWVFLKEPDRFRLAEEVRYNDERRRTRSWSGFGVDADLEVKKDPISLAAFTAAIRARFETPNVHVDIFDRHRVILDGEECELVQVAVYREGRPEDMLGFDANSTLSRRIVKPVFEAALTYEAATGVIEVVAKTREDRIDLTRFMARDLLGHHPWSRTSRCRCANTTSACCCGRSTSRPTRPTGSSQRDRQGTAPDGSRRCAKERITLESMSGADRYDLADGGTPDRPGHRRRCACVRSIAGDVPEWVITRARFTIKFHPGPSGGRGKSLALNVTMPHGCNLKDMTAQERLIGEKYLRLWGILKDDNDEGDVLE